MKKTLQKLLLKLKILIQKIRRRKTILLLSNMITMDEHLLRYYESVKDSKYRCKFVFFKSGNFDKERYKNYNLPSKMVIKNKFAYNMTNPSLTILADFWGMPFFVRDAGKVLYIGHGTTTVKGNNGVDAYCYSCAVDESIGCKIDCILESNKKIYEHYSKDDRFENVVWTGHKYSQLFDNEMLNYDKYRDELKINKNQKAIFIVGSWNDNSLFHKLGVEFLEKIKELAKNDKYKFILSIHPLEYLSEDEYKKYKTTQKPMGEMIDELEQYGCIIRKAGTDFMPYLIASDLVFCDYSSMSDNAIMAEKNIIYSEFPNDNLFELSSPYRLKNVLPVVKNASQFEDILSKKYSDKYKEHILNVKKEMYAEKSFYENQCKKVTEDLSK